MSKEAAAIPASDGVTPSKPGSSYEAVRRLAASNAVVLFSMSDCCMCTVAKTLLFLIGISPTVVELDKLDGGGHDIHAVLRQLAPGGNGVLHDRQVLPAVFVGGKFLGGLETLMTRHINGTLVPLLKDAGSSYEAVRRLAASNAVVLFSMSDCCMCTVAKTLLFLIGVSPRVVELDKLDGGGHDIHAVLCQLAPGGSGVLHDRQVLPAIFVGGKFLGGLETLMSRHINGTLVPLLKDAGSSYEAVRRLAASSTVVLFSMSDCCICTVAKTLCFLIGVSPTVVELDKLDGGGHDIHAVLRQLAPGGSGVLHDRQVLPAVFVGGKFLGGLETLMTHHINGTLVPLLKDAAVRVSLCPLPEHVSDAITTGARRCESLIVPLADSMF